MLRAAEADSLRSELDRALRVFTGIRVGSYPQIAALIGPAEDLLEMLVCLGLNQLDVGERHDPRRAVDCDLISRREDMLADLDPLAFQVDPKVDCAGNARAPHTPRDKGRV